LGVNKEPLARHNHAIIIAFVSETNIVLKSLEQQQLVADKVDEEFDRCEEDIGYIREVINYLDPARSVLQEALGGLRGKITSIEELIDSSQELPEVVSLTQKLISLK